MDITAYRNHLELKDSWNNEAVALIIKKMTEHINKFDNSSGMGFGGNSGELFFMSNDKKFIIKTIKADEGKVFQEILANQMFIDRFLSNENKSFINKIYGYLEFTFPGLNNKKQSLIIIENIAPISEEKILRKYDLKGSTLGRQTLSAQNLSRKSDISLSGLNLPHSDT